MTWLLPLNDYRWTTLYRLRHTPVSCDSFSRNGSGGMRNFQTTFVSIGCHQFLLALNPRDKHTHTHAILIRQSSVLYTHTWCAHMTPMFMDRTLGLWWLHVAYVTQYTIHMNGWSNELVQRKECRPSEARWSEANRVDATKCNVIVKCKAINKKKPGRNPILQGILL
jgi:hypothetical protein